ncbi:MAG: efflux RND transporter periplasmic adaptor subunit [Spirochaetaceae bacterium]|nr:efflux RND transporter periplasmic adaptor subunit [Myxococcales bacterium]MCB9726279.1 efflux RND transporter periplasmic adaptor subunit [Spirochaetaceae bacterium]
MGPRQSSFRKATPLVLALASLLLGVACSEEEVATEDLLPSVSAVRLAPVTLDEELHASGDLVARFHTEIAAEVAGRVTGVSVDEGHAVEEGAVVLELDPERRHLDLQAARARLAQARANLRKERSQTERVRQLRAKNISSVQQLEEAETTLLLAESSVRAEEAAVGVAARALSDASVAAPFAGMVARRSVELGEFVQPGDVLFELVALDPLEVVFALTELDTERVSLGQSVQIRVGAFPDRVFTGTVSFVAPTVDPETRTLRIKAEIDNGDALLRPGLFARVSLGVNRRENVLMVPEEAVVQRSGGASVYRLTDDDRVERVAVEVGSQLQDRVEIRGDVHAGDRIVRRGHGGLANGMSVVVREVLPAPISTAGEPAEGSDS